MPFNLHTKCSSVLNEKITAPSTISLELSDSITLVLRQSQPAAGTKPSTSIGDKRALKILQTKRLFSCVLDDGHHSWTSYLLAFLHHTSSSVTSLKTTTDALKSASMSLCQQHVGDVTGTPVSAKLLHLLTARNVTVTVLPHFVYQSVMLVYFKVPGGRFI